MEVPLPVLTKILYVFPPFTWFGMFCVFSVLFLLKDKVIGVAWLNPLLILLLILFFGVAVIALFLPQIVDVQKISPH